MLLMLVSSSQTQHFDTVTLMLEGQDLNEYNCTVNKMQIKKSPILTGMFTKLEDDSGKIVFNTSILIDGVSTCPLSCDGDFEFVKTGFNDMCDYFQNNNFSQDYNCDEYQLPIPLLLNNSNDFYHHVKELTYQEREFMKKIESFDDSNNNTNNPFNIDMTRMNNLFKIAEYLQMKRLLTIIAARHASLMKNMNKTQMIHWLDNIINNNNSHNACNNTNNTNDNNNQNHNEKIIPETPSSNSDSNNNYNEEYANDQSEFINSIWVPLTQMLPFFSCYDIHTFSSISKKFSDFVDEWLNLKLNIDPMVKILTNNNDSTCLSLTNQEIVFHKPFLTLPQHQWSENQNDMYNQLKTMTNNTIIQADWRKMYFFGASLLASCGNKYYLYRLHCTISSGDRSIVIRGQRDSMHFCTISFKFGEFAQQINMLAKLRNIEYIVLHWYHLSSFDDLIGVNTISNIKAINIEQYSFPFINFQEIYNINNQLEDLTIVSSNENRTKTRSVKHMEFLSKMKSLKQLDLYGNNLDSFDFDALKGLSNLQLIRINKNKFDYKLDTQCLDFAFLDNVPNLKELHLDHNQIECINNFMTIQKHSNLEKLDLGNNNISSLNLNAFKGTNLKHIYLYMNKLSNLGDDNTSQLQPCLDFNSLNDMPQLQILRLEFNQIRCIVHFELIQQHTQLKDLHLENNYFLSSIDFTKFDESKPKMNDIHQVNFNNMNMKYTMQNNNCLDLQFLKFMPNVERLYFAHNKIECVDNVSVLQREDVKLKELYLDHNNLLSFDFADLIGSNIELISLRHNNLSFASLKNFNDDTLSQINPSDMGMASISILQGNDDKLQRLYIPHVCVL